MFKFKVISKFPFSPWEVGIVLRVMNPKSVLLSQSIGYINLLDYPHIFQKVSD